MYAVRLRFEIDPGTSPFIIVCVYCYNRNVDPVISITFTIMCGVPFVYDYNLQSGLHCPFIQLYFAAGLVR
jgi:hypothetical protein